MELSETRIDHFLSTIDHLMGSGVYDDRTGPELAQIISENAFVCIYLVFQFSQLGKKMVEGHKKYVRHAFGSRQVEFLLSVRCICLVRFCYRHIQFFSKIKTGNIFKQFV